MEDLKKEKLENFYKYIKHELAVMANKKIEDKTFNYMLFTAYNQINDALGVIDFIIKHGGFNENKNNNSINSLYQYAENVINEKVEEYFKKKFNK